MRRILEEPLLRAAWRARLLRPYRQFQFAQFGETSMLDRPEWIYGAHHIAIGSGVVILSRARLSAERATWHHDAPSIVIGDHVMFRTELVISATSAVVIEDNVLGGAGISIIDCDHTITEADHNPLHNPVISDPIRVGSGTWLGDKVTVLRGADIGRKCVVGAHSVVNGCIPDHSVAVGVPARVVGRTAAR